MNNLSGILLSGSYNYDVEEYVKQGSSLTFDSSTEQRVTAFSIPAITITLSYRGLSDNDFANLRSAYESNYANTFICDLGSFIDKRPDFMTTNASVWAFSEFRFAKSAGACDISGTITLYTSVFFNFSAYQNLFSESSNNVVATTTDTTFRDLLDTSSPKAVTYTYENNTIASNIGISRRLTQDKQGLKRIYTLVFLLEEPEFVAMLTYYRKKSGIMGNFGIPDIEINESTIVNARFKHDSFNYVKRLDGLYEAELSIVENKG